MLGIFFNYLTTSCTRRPSVIIIPSRCKLYLIVMLLHSQACKHLFLLSILYTGADNTHKLVSHILGVKSCSDMHMKASHSHVLEVINLAK